MISVIIPNFNGAKLLEKNLPKLLDLLAKSNLGNEVIISDDCSTDHSVQIIEKLVNENSLKNEKCKLKILTSERNVGFAGNIDRGIRAAKGEIVFTLKTDVLPESSDYFRLMLDHFEDPKVFAVSAALKTVEGGKEEIRGQGVLIFFRGLFLHFRTYDDYTAWFETMRSTKWLQQMGMLPKKLAPQSSKFSAWADGGASALRRDLYVKIGGFDPLYNPFYWEDTDLGFRAWKAGYQIAFEPRAILLHDYESGAIAQHYTKEQVQIISQRNQFIFVWKNGDLKHLFLYAIWKAYHAVVALKNANWTYFQALWQAFLLWPRILAARYQQKKVTRLTDDQALGIISLT